MKQNRNLKLIVLGFHILVITCSTVRGLILLATQDGMAEYLEAQANLTISNCVLKLGIYHVKSL